MLTITILTFVQGLLFIWGLQATPFTFMNIGGQCSFDGEFGTLRINRIQGVGRTLKGCKNKLNYNNNNY